MKKPFSSLNRRDFRKHPVWEYCNDIEAETGDETLMRPVGDLPVECLDNRIAATEIRLANGQSVDGVVGCIDLQDHVRTEHFVSVTLYRDDGRPFHLARYHDIDADSCGPNACAAFFGLTVEEMFPIAYDIDAVAIGVPASVRRKVPAVPHRRLSDEELMRMAVRMP